MLKVLIAEDNYMLADILETFLQVGGYEVCGIARTVSEAVALADFHKPDLAILDYRMGNGEFGTQVGRRLTDRSMMGILYASGDPLNDKLTTIDGEAFIQKPYQMKDVLQGLQIVHAIKAHKDTSHLPFPNNFRLLEQPVDEHRLSA